MLTIAPTRNNRRAVYLGICCALVLGSPALKADTQSDYLADVQRLLEVSDTQQHFQNMANRQVRAIIRSYSSIVAMEADVSLPRQLTNSIADCYARMYAWENFESGIAEILAQQLSQEEVLILIDFYSDLGMAPSQISTFKATIEKAPSIEAESADYIFSKSAGCVHTDASLIYHYLSALRQLPIASEATP